MICGEYRCYSPHNQEICGIWAFPIAADRRKTAVCGDYRPLEPHGHTRCQRIAIPDEYAVAAVDRLVRKKSPALKPEQDILGKFVIESQRTAGRIVRGSVHWHNVNPVRVAEVFDPS